ncbi:MAG: thioredoxin family protein [Bacteroidota bacterium]
MRKAILIFLITILSFGSTKALNFYDGNYQQALAKAKAENKRILLYFTAKWCGPCKYMEQYVYPDGALTAYVNQYYIALKIDIDTKAGKLLYVQAHQAKGLMGVPAFIIMNSKEEILKSQKGGMKLNQLQQFLFIDKNEPIIYKLLADSLARKQITNSYKKPTFWSKFYFNTMVSNWKPAIKIGTNLTSFSSSLAIKASPAVGYEIGIFMDRSFKNMDMKRGFWHKSRYSFQPGLSLTSKVGNIVLEGIENQLKIQYLELGLLNSYQFKGLRHYKLTASPYVATGLWATRKPGYSKQKIDFEKEFNKFDYGVRVGLSRQMGSFEPFLGYSIGLRDIKPGAAVIKTRGFYLSFATIIGK